MASGMKVVLSRKGMDSSAGGVASPILPDGTLCPLPIPDPRAPTCYGELRVAGLDLGAVVRSLTEGRLGARTRAHHDPDLEASAHPRPSGFRALFGQAGSAQVHLSHQGVQAGDVFLFFGWFRASFLRAGRLAFLPQAPDLHVLFGWLQVEAVLRVDDARAAALPGAALHPHFHGERGAHNVVYVAAERLSLPGVGQGPTPGAGLFPRIHPNLVLTAVPGAGRRSDWRLPGWFWPPSEAAPRLSHHRDLRRWSREGRHVRLRSVGRGQEFVLAPRDPRTAARWIHRLVSCGLPPSSEATIEISATQGGSRCPSTSSLC